MTPTGPLVLWFTVFSFKVNDSAVMYVVMFPYCILDTVWNDFIYIFMKIVVIIVVFSL